MDNKTKWACGGLAAVAWSLVLDGIFIHKEPFWDVLVFGIVTAFGFSLFAIYLHQPSVRYEISQEPDQGITIAHRIQMKDSVWNCYFVSLSFLLASMIVLGIFVCKKHVAVPFPKVTPLFGWFLFVFGSFALVCVCVILFQLGRYIARALCNCLKSVYRELAVCASTCYDCCFASYKVDRVPPHVAAAAAARGRVIVHV